MNIFNIKTEEDWINYQKSIVYLLVIFGIGSAIIGGALNNQWVTSSGPILYLVMLFISALTNREYIIKHKGKGHYITAIASTWVGVALIICITYLLN